jgi:hypothetical protein
MSNVKFQNENVAELSREEIHAINGSGLFYWNTHLDDQTKSKIFNWYKSLSEEQREFVDILRHEHADDQSFYDPS